MRREVERRKTDSDAKEEAWGEGGRERSEKGVEKFAKLLFFPRRELARC